jgi:uroporphyrin-3 C-methyltransferase
MTEPEKPNQSDPAPIAEVVTNSQAALVTPPAATAPISSKNSNSGGRGLGVIAIILSLVALGISAYSYYKNEIDAKAKETQLTIKMVEVGGDVARIGDSLSRLQADQKKGVSKEQLTTRLLESNNAVDLQFRDVRQSQLDMQNAITQINSDLNRGVNDFVLEEVSQLLKMANNSALFSGDARLSAKALQLADLQLKEIADPRFSSVRRKINQEIALLENIEQIDLESVTVKLKGLAVRIPTLALENDVPATGKLTIDASGEPDDLKGWLNEMWADIVNYNSVQRIDKAPKPLLLPEQRYFLNQNIQLQLAKAELALMQNHAVYYSDSLETATQWLNEYFDLRDESVKQVLAQIAELKAMSLSQELPVISGSYSELQAIRGGL